MEPKFELETPEQEKARLDQKDGLVLQPTLVDSIKSATPNLYPDHKTNPGSALLAVTNDQNADPMKLAEITAAADKKYMVGSASKQAETPVEKPAEETKDKPLDDAHVQAMKEERKKIFFERIEAKNNELFWKVEDILLDQFFVAGHQSDIVGSKNIEKELISVLLGDAKGSGRLMSNIMPAAITKAYAKEEGIFEESELPVARSMFIKSINSFSQKKGMPEEVVNALFVDNTDNLKTAEEISGNLLDALTKNYPDLISRNKDRYLKREKGDWSKAKTNPNFTESF